MVSEWPEYPHTDNVWARDDTTHRLIEDAWRTPEFGLLRDVNWRATEKVDGTNIRIFVGEEGIPMVLGRTKDAQLPRPLLQALTDLLTPKIARLKAQFSITNAYEEGTSKVVLYGEGYGPGIQRGGWYRDTPGFILFDVRVGRWWLTWDTMVSIAMALELDHVPVVTVAPLPMLVSLVRGGFRSIVAQAATTEQAEGVVARPLVDLFDRRGNRIQVKIKTKDFREWQA